MPLIDQPTVLFMHVPKTAGTSLRSALQRAVPADLRVFLYDDPPGIPVTEFTALPEEERAKPRLVFGHFRFGLHADIPRPSRYVTMLRHPADRLISLYYHYRAIEGGRFHEIIAERSISLMEFVESGSFLEADNGMIHQLTALRGVPFGKLDERHLDKAREVLREHFEPALVMEEMADSMTRLGRLLDVRLGEVRRENVSRDPGRLEDVPEDIYQRIIERNPWDLALYEETRAAIVASAQASAEAVSKPEGHAPPEPAKVAAAGTPTVASAPAAAGSGAPGAAAAPSAAAAPATVSATAGAEAR